MHAAQVLAGIQEEYSKTRELSKERREEVIARTLEVAQPHSWSKDKDTKLNMTSNVPLWMLAGHFPSCKSKADITFEQLASGAQADELEKAARRFFLPPPRLIVQLE